MQNYSEISEIAHKTAYFFDLISKIRIVDCLVTIIE